MPNQEGHKRFFFERMDYIAGAKVAVFAQPYDPDHSYLNFNRQSLEIRIANLERQGFDTSEERHARPHF